MTRRRVLQISVFVLVLMCALPVLSWRALSQNTAAPDASKQKGAEHAKPHEQEEGARIFDANCSRCHAAPEGFSPRISGTIMQHMRVRASLSKHDEQELLRFFNP